MLGSLDCLLEEQVLNMVSQSQLKSFHLVTLKVSAKSFDFLKVVTPLAEI